MLHTCLKGLRVLDLSQYIPGPYATLLLADMGAEVVKVEPPHGDPMRSFGPGDSDGVSPFYKVLNASKTVIPLDLKSPEGTDALTTLVKNADVLLESFRPGVLDRLGFGAERLRQINPRLVHCAVSGFGQDGPYRLRAGHDATYLALTGALAATGTVERPTLPFPPLADHAGALHAVMGILAALVRRGHTGQGATLDISLFESALALNALGLTLGVRGAGMLQREADLLNGGAAYYRLYRCADGAFAALAPIEPKFWQAFCQAVERPDWLPRQNDPFPQTALAEEIQALLASRPLADWLALLEPVDCCFEAVLEVEAVLSNPQVAARGFVRSLGAGADARAEVVFPAKLDGEAPAPRRPCQEAAAAEVIAAWGAAPLA